MTAAAYDCTVWEHWLSAGAGNATNLDPLGQSVGQNTARCQKSDSLWTKIAEIGVFASTADRNAQCLHVAQSFYLGFLATAFLAAEYSCRKWPQKCRFPQFLSTRALKSGNGHHICSAAYVLLDSRYRIALRNACNEAHLVQRCLRNPEERRVSAVRKPHLPKRRPSVFQKTRIAVCSSKMGAVRKNGPCAYATTVSVVFAGAGRSAAQWWQRVAPTLTSSLQ